MCAPIFSPEKSPSSKKHQHSKTALQTISADEFLDILDPLSNNSNFSLIDLENMSLRSENSIELRPLVDPQASPQVSHAGEIENTNESSNTKSTTTKSKLLTTYKARTVWTKIIAVMMSLLTCGVLVWWLAEKLTMKESDWKKDTWKVTILNSIPPNMFGNALGYIITHLKPRWATNRDWKIAATCFVFLWGVVVTAVIFKLPGGGEHLENEGDSADPGF